MNKVILSRLTKEDIEQVVSIELNELNETLGYEMIESELDSNSVFFIVAKIDEEVIGYISYYSVFDSIEVLNFCVKDSYKRKGIGTLLFNYCISSNIDLRVCTLEVKITNDVAINFYKKHGFSIVSIRYNYYKDGSNAYLMMKEFNNEDTRN